MVPLNAPAAQLDDMRMAFMAGAQHLFASMLTILDPGVEETTDEMRRMDLIDKELRTFAQELELRFGKPKGTA